MSKYILAKDVFFAKKGSSVYISNGAKDEDGIGIPISVWRGSVFVKDEGILKELMSNNWIEKVKPREFLVFLNKEGFPIDIFLPDLAPERALDEVIKVREVL